MIMNKIITIGRNKHMVEYVDKYSEIKNNSPELIINGSGEDSELFVKFSIQSSELISEFTYTKYSLYARIVLSSPNNSSRLYKKYSHSRNGRNTVNNKYGTRTIPHRMAPKDSIFNSKSFPLAEYNVYSKKTTNIEFAFTNISKLIFPNKEYNISELILPVIYYLKNKNINNTLNKGRFNKQSFIKHKDSAYFKMYICVNISENYSLSPINDEIILSKLSIPIFIYFSVLENDVFNINKETVIDYNRNGNKETEVITIR